MMIGRPIFRCEIDSISVRNHWRQWRDQADTLQFDSTDEYFETVEYEPDRSLEHRDILGKPPNFEIFEV